jgi:hypothetical protein
MDQDGGGGKAGGKKKGKGGGKEKNAKKKKGGGLSDVERTEMLKNVYMVKSCLNAILSHIMAMSCWHTYTKASGIRIRKLLVAFSASHSFAHFQLPADAS